MSFVWFFKPEFKAPYLSDDVQESCVLACDYFSMILDDFIARFPEHRQPQHVNRGLWMSHASSILEP